MQDIYSILQRPRFFINVCVYLISVGFYLFCVGYALYWLYTAGLKQTQRKRTAFLVYLLLISGWLLNIYILYKYWYDGFSVHIDFSDLSIATIFSVNTLQSAFNFHNMLTIAVLVGVLLHSLYRLFRYDDRRFVSLRAAGILLAAQGYWNFIFTYMHELMEFYAPAWLNMKLLQLKMLVFDMRCCFIFWICILWGRRIFRQKKQQGMHDLFSFSSVLVLLPSFLASALSRNQSMDAINYYSFYGDMWIMLQILLVTCILASYVILRSQERALQLLYIEREKQNILTQLTLQREHYRDLKLQMRESSKMRHDVKNFIYSLYGYLENEQYDAVKEMVKKYDHRHHGSVLRDYGNEAVNALMQKKQEDMERWQITADISLVIPDPMHIDELDLCILLGNALDNAIEALQKVPKEERFLEVRLYAYEQFVSLYVNNRVLPTPISFCSDKAQVEQLHGFGLFSMRSIAEKYYGSLQIEQKKDLVELHVLLLNKQL